MDSGDVRRRVTFFILASIRHAIQERKATVFRLMILCGFAFYALSFIDPTALPVGSISFYAWTPFSLPITLARTSLGRLAQLVRASRLHREGRRFEPCSVHHVKIPATCWDFYVPRDDESARSFTGLPIEVAGIHVARPYLSQESFIAYPVCHMGLRVIALGTGVCVSGIPAIVDRHPPGFLVEVDGLYILFDCSEGIRQRLHAAGIDYGLIAHVAVTHAHPDHAALPQFIQARFCRHLWGGHDPRTEDLSVYLPRTLARDFPQVWNWHQPENDGGYWEGFVPKIVPLDDASVHELAPNVKLHATNVYHGFGRHPAMGFRLETPYGVVAYSGDTGLCEGVRVLAQSADLFISDCQVRVGQEYTGGYGHMGPRQCGDVALKSGVKQLWLTHYLGIDAGDVVLSEVRAAGYFGEAKLAQDGDRWEKK